MFELSAAHEAAFVRGQRAAFIEELALASYDYAPDDAPFLTKCARLTAAELVFRNAANHGYSTRGGLFFWLNLATIFGSHFHSDPQFSDVCLPRQLMDDPQEMSRLSQAYRGITVYISDIHGGPSNSLYTQAAEAFSAHMKTTSADPIPTIEAMAAIYPQKMQRHHDVYLRNLSAGIYAEKAAKLLRSEHPDAVLFVACLDMLFGHRFETDAFKPWIGNTLAQCLPNSPADHPRFDAFFAVFDPWIDSD